MRTDLWQRGCERLASELPDQQFNTWIRPLPDADVNDEAETAVVTVRVPNRFKLDWIRNQYASRIETVLSELAGKPVRLDVTLAPQDGVARPTAVAGHAAAVRAFAVEASRLNGHASSPPAHRTSRARRGRRLLPSCTPSCPRKDRCRRAAGSTRR